MATIPLLMNRPTLWLTVSNFAKKMNRQPITIYKWCESGFIVELGYLLRKDCTGRWSIGIPHKHESYLNFL